MMYNVLIVDDEQLTRTFIKTIIPTLHSKWQVAAEASDGEEACLLLASQHIDLVITDIKMPLMNGIALCEYIQRHYPHIITVILSGYGEFEYAQKAIAYHVSNYLLKPIVNEELQTMLCKISCQLDQKTASNHEHAELLQLSSKYKGEMTTTLLQAIITESHVQIKTLMPVLHQLEIDLMDEEGVILMVQPSHGKSSLKCTLENLGLTKLLIYQTALKTLSHTTNIVLLDPDGNTLIYMPLTQPVDLDNATRFIHDTVNTAFAEATSINLVISVGSVETDILQLSVSYDCAKKARLQALFSDDQTPVVTYQDALYGERNHQTTTMISTLGYSLLTHDPITAKLMKDRLSEFSAQYISPVHTAPFCFYILTSLCDYLTLDYSILKDVTDLHQGIGVLESFINKPALDGLAENELVSMAKTFILERYHEPISLSLIADTLSISPSYLSNLFHESVGHSYVKYLTDVRMKQAALLLRGDRKITLEEITKKVGYISVKHLSYVFKKHYNLTTSEYRNG